MKRHLNRFKIKWNILVWRSHCWCAEHSTHTNCEVCATIDYRKMGF